MDVYTLICEDITGAGGPAGGSSKVLWKKNFVDPNFAKKIAQKDYVTQSGKSDIMPIHWKETSWGWSSGDLSFVMYSLEKLVINEEEDEDIPQQLEEHQTDYSKLRKICNDYVEYMYGDKYRGDGDWEHYIFEEAMITLYGNNIFSELNEKMI